MEVVLKDGKRKTYDYFSRYANDDTYYNVLDKKRFYGTSRCLNQDLSSYRKHTVMQNESLDSIALKYYNNPLYWWIIADVNGISDPFSIRVGMELKVPSLSLIEFK